jgi:AraC family transcriptional regulator
MSVQDVVRPAPALERIELRGRSAAADLLGRRAARGPWSGIRVVELASDAAEVTGGSFRHHVVALHVSEPIAVETRFRGARSWTTTLVPRGAIEFVPAHVAFQARWSQPKRAIVVEIAPELVAAVAGASGRPLDLRPSLGGDDAFARHLVLALAAEARAGAPGGSLCGESLGAALVAHLLRRHGPARPHDGAAEARGAARVDRAIAHVRAHLHGPLSLHELAAVAEMDVFRFVRAFKERTGMPPHRFVLQVRVEAAKALLRDRALSISDVALRTGFATPSHFATTFRKTTRATPRAWRESLR